MHKSWNGKEPLIVEPSSDKKKEAAIDLTIALIENIAADYALLHARGASDLDEKTEDIQCRIVNTRKSLRAVLETLIK